MLRIEREFFIDNLLVRIHLIIEMILVDRPCAMGDAAHGSRVSGNNRAVFTLFGQKLLFGKKNKRRHGKMEKS